MNFILIIFSWWSVYTSQHLIVHESEALKSDDVHFELLHYLFLWMLLLFPWCQSLWMVLHVRCEVHGGHWIFQKIVRQCRKEMLVLFILMYQIEWCAVEKWVVLCVKIWCLWSVAWQLSCGVTFVIRAVSHTFSSLIVPNFGRQDTFVEL